jgi:hypothetical protein
MLFLFTLIACDTSSETTYASFNADDNSVTISVGTETEYETDTAGTLVLDDAGEPVPVSVSTTLTSTADEVELGTGSVSPSAGPVGTTHTVRVDLDEDYASDVDRVTIETSSGDRGTDTYELEADSAGDGVWVIQLVSYGEEGEVREDTMTFHLYEAVTTTTEDSGAGGFTLF